MNSFQKILFISIFVQQIFNNLEDDEKLRKGSCIYKAQICIGEIEETLDAIKKTLTIIPHIYIKESLKKDIGQNLNTEYNQVEGPKETVYTPKLVTSDFQENLPVNKYFLSIITDNFKFNQLRSNYDVDDITQFLNKMMSEELNKNTNINIENSLNPSSCKKYNSNYVGVIERIIPCDSKLGIIFPHNSFSLKRYKQIGFCYSSTCGYELRMKLIFGPFSKYHLESSNEDIYDLLKKRNQEFSSFSQYDINKSEIEESFKGKTV